MKYLKIFSLAAAVVVGLAMAGGAQAYYPTMTTSNSGNSTTIYINGAQPYAPVVVSYTPYGSSLATNITGTTDSGGTFTTMISSANASQITATVGGQQVYANGNGGGNGGCGYSNCNVGGLVLNPSSLSLTTGQ